MINAVQYDSGYESPLGRACFEKEERLLMGSALLTGSKRVLQVGCGTGRFPLSMMKKSPNVIGVDREFSFLRFAKQREKELGLHLNLIQADAIELPSHEGQFDIVYEITTLCLVHEKVP